MKRSIITALIVGSIASIWLLAGCGNPTGGGGGGGGGGSANPNMGTISGYVYTYNRTTGVYSGISAVVSVSTEAMTLEVAASTDADGKYTLMGLPSGTVAVTATREVGGSWANLREMTIVANSDIINFVICGMYEPGTSTIRGTIEGLAGNPALEIYTNVTVRTASGRRSDYSFSYNPGTYRYEITGAPADRDTYVNIMYDKYGYNKIDTSGGGQYSLNISLESWITLEGTVLNIPDNYLFEQADAEIFNNHRFVSEWFYTCNKTGPESFSLNIIPAKSGDSYCAYINANSADSAFFKYFYYDNLGTKETFDLSSLALPEKLVTSPSVNEIISGTPSFEWNSVPGVTYYYLECYDKAIPYTSFYWGVYTCDTRISLPACVMSQMISGHKYYFSVEAVKYINPDPIYNLNIFTSNREIDYDLSGAVVFSWEASGILGKVRSGDAAVRSASNMSISSNEEKAKILEEIIRMRREIDR